VKKRIFGSVII